MAAPDLLPRDEEKADYFRWLFFAAGSLEPAITAHALGWKPDEEQQVMVGFGSFERVIDTLDGWLSTHSFVCGDRFTMADVYVGSQVDWGLMFGSIPERTSFTAYAARFRARPAYEEGKAIDGKLIQEMQAEQAPEA